MNNKIVIVNRWYFKAFGPTIYLFNISKMLEADGCEVIPFSVNRLMNNPTPYSKYFVDPPYDEAILFFNDAKISTWQKLKVFANCIYSFQAKVKMERLLDDEKVDLVYLLAITNDISPSIISACKKRNIPVVMRLSDFYLVCGNYHFMRDNKLCTLCVDKNVMQCVKYKCVKNSLLPSATRAIAMTIHNIIKIYDYVDAFICPCMFMKEALVKAGFPEDKLHHVNSFIDTSIVQPKYESGDYVLYFGRFSPEKGIDYLLTAISTLPRSIKLRLVGSSNDNPYFEVLRAMVVDYDLRLVEFCDREDGDELMKMIQGSRFVVVPSVCADNSPLSVIESMACGKPVIGSDIGGISEQIIHGKTGYLVPPADTQVLAERIAELWNNQTLVENMGKNARIHVEKNFSADQHFGKLKSIFTDCINKHLT